MPKYLLQWTEEHWFQHMVEAPSEEAAREMIFEGTFRWPEAYAYEIQDSVDVMTNILDSDPELQYAEEKWEQLTLW